MILGYDVLELPEWSMKALVNRDYSGLTEEERSMIDCFLEKYEFIDLVCDGETGEFKDPGFSWNPEFGHACNVYDCYCKPREVQNA